jgi:hypothetical protein
MMAAAKNAGCTVVNVYKTPIHGISFVFEIKKGVFAIPELLALKDETTRGVYRDSFYTAYRNQIQGLKETSLAMLKEFVDKGYSILGFGAAAKGNVFLNYIFDSRPSPYAPECILDDSLLKQGKFTAGTEIEVVGYDRLQSYVGKKLLIVILAWNFSAEITQRIQKTIPAGIEYKCLQFFPSVIINDCSHSDERNGQSTAESHTLYE